MKKSNKMLLLGAIAGAIAAGVYYKGSVGPR